MPRVRSAFFALTLALAASIMLSGCGWVVSWFKREPKQPKATVHVSEYDQLAEKAHKGDVDAARKLAKWCYQHDADNERAKYWLKVAAEHGDESSAKVGDYVQEWR